MAKLWIPKLPLLAGRDATSIAAHVDNMKKARRSTRRRKPDVLEIKGKEGTDTTNPGSNSRTVTSVTSRPCGRPQSLSDQERYCCHCHIH